MRLERLEATQRPEKLKAVFDGEALTVSASLCVQFSLCAGMELDEEAFSALKAAVAKEAARERAVRILTASAVSERENVPTQRNFQNMQLLFPIKCITILRN